MKRLCSLLLLFCSVYTSAQQDKTKAVYFPLDSFRLSQELVETIETAYWDVSSGNKITFRVLIHEDIKNKGILNELNRKRAQELYDFFVAEGIPKNSLKLSKIIGREAKGFISDDMKNLLVYDVEVYKNLPAVTFSVSDELGRVTDPPQQFTVPSGEEKQITGARGTLITFPAQAFEFKTGLAVKGEVNIELKEYVTPGAMAAAGLISMSNEIPLQAAGFVWLKALSGDKEVRLRKGKSIKILTPGPGTQLNDPELFYGQEIDGLVNLTEQDPKAGAKLTEPRYYELVSPHLHWLACAGIGKADAKGTLSVKTGVSYNVAVRLILKEQKEVLAAYYMPKVKDPMFTRMDTGVKGILVGYGKKDGKVYFCSKEITTSTDGKEKLQLKESSEAVVKAFLNGLDK